MLERLRNRLGTAGLIVSVMALVLAVAGGAYAASGALTGKQKKEVKNIAKQYAGKPGPAGPAGANGVAGPKGDAGAAGSNGKDGVSVTSTAATPAECPDGGSKFTSASGTSKACNGEDGESGFTATLPPGETLTGIWGVNNAGQQPTDEGAPHPQGFISVPVSFSIPLEEAPEVAYVDVWAPTADCPGVEEGIPTAKPGKLCFYGAEMEGMERSSPPATEFTYTDTPPGEYTEWKSGASPVGTIFRMKCTASYCKAGGYWAVTAAEE